MNSIENVTELEQQIRFKDNDGNDYPDWVCKYGNEVFAVISNKNHNSDLPILAITQDKGAIPRDMIDYKMTVTEASVSSYKVVEVGDFIISLRSFQGGIEYSEYKGICSPAYIILRAKIEVNNAFYKYYLKTYNYIQELKRKLEGIRDGKMISYKYFSEIQLPFPCLEEQQKIANFLSEIDKKIEQLTEKNRLLTEYKKGVMQQIFTQQIRFKDNQGNDYPEWEEKRLGSISKRKTEKNKDETQRLVLTNSAVQGIVSQTDYFDKDIANQNNLGGYYIVEQDDFVYNPRISVSAPVGPIKRNHLSTGVMSPLYSVFAITKGSKNFFERYFETNLWHRYMNQIANFGARHDRMNVTTADFYNMPMPYPCLEEQQKIANFLTEIDQKTDQAWSILEQTKAFKKGLLQKMFV